MPTFVIIATDAADKGNLRAETRPRHLDYLAGLGDALMLAGPMLDHAGAQPVGSMILGTFQDLAAARAFAAADPYAEAGLFDDVTVAQWRQVLPSQSA